MTEPGWTWAVNHFGSSKFVDINGPLDTEPARVTERGLVVQYPGLALPSSSFDTVEKLRSFRVYARITEGVIYTFQIQQADPSTKKDVKTADAHMEKRKFYVLFWDHTHQVLPSVPMMAAVVSTPEVQGRGNTERVCEFEFVARFEILSIYGHYEQDVDKEAEKVDGTWVIQ
jgi:hypothetical protein